MCSNVASSDTSFERAGGAGIRVGLKIGVTATEDDPSVESAQRSDPAGLASRPIDQYEVQTGGKVRGRQGADQGRPGRRSGGVDAAEEHEVVDDRADPHASGLTRTRSTGGDSRSPAAVPLM